MKYDITSDACRICLRKSSSCRSIFKPRDGDIAPNIKLNLITGVNVPEKDEIPGLPQCICKQCEISVNMAFNLRKRARRSDQILSVYCNKMNKDNIIVELADGRKFKLSKELTLKVIRGNKPPTLPQAKHKSQVHFEQIHLDEYNDNDDDIDNDNDDDMDDNVNDDEDDDNDSNDEEDIQSISGSDGNIDDNDIENDEDAPFENDRVNQDDFKEESSDNDIAEIICTTEVELENDIKPTYNGEEIANKIKASNQYELLSWKQEDDLNAIPTFKLRLKEPEEKAVSKDFICDICGNTYSQRHRLMEHMRRHNPEKIFACEICGKRFAVSEGLRRHVLTHGAQKPFKCNFCTRCFYTPSARKAHEKVHSGAKPFVCNICTKAFAYTCSLRKHLLIHENKKLYRCEYCDKEFRLQHHMKQHEETQIHKDAVAECTRTKSSEEFKLEF
ncbi:zinc finger protein 652-B-like [Episyrphus balteatus]|uniref:zinc finger protein 652-B-like n=1 Tax=Episyrphus balteatus TaxID=286459 RepID=UPI00248669FE|nr:zinc finger protein 652-B-like [Episyrphus balteatus]